MDRRHWTGYGCLITVVIYKAYLVAFAVGITKPTISVEFPSVEWGGTVKFTCTIRDEDYQQTKGTFFFNKTNTEKKDKLVSFTWSNVKFEDEEQSTCCYRWNDTESSCSTVKFNVTVQLQKPTISASLDRKQWSSSGIQVTRGDSFVINCSTSAIYPEGQFLLWFSGTNSSVSEPSVNHSASFSIPVSQNQHHGQYSCVYQVTGAGRTYNSPRSAVVVVTVKEPLLTIILPVVAVILLLLLFIGLYCLHRRRRRVAEFTPSSPAPMMAINQYEESDDEEEADYVNAPNEREDEDSDGPDYENVTAVSDRYSVDIYGGSDDNVYQNI